MMLLKIVNIKNWLRKLTIKKLLIPSDLVKKKLTTTQKLMNLIRKLLMINMVYKLLLNYLIS